mmetsp:Transcript_189/g.481  ORF Transcript_189/g.481 Transcript_189/m.481 type:complete len:659 (-) Transcript_189:99-2075(-)
MRAAALFILVKGLALVVVALPPGTPFQSLRRTQVDVDAFLCQGPAQGCTNGLFNQKECRCDCIKPYCPSPQTGDCTTGGICDNENPWADCIPEENCPWFLDDSVPESCTTGSQLPQGLLEIFQTRNACCFVNFPYSNTCPEETNPPTAKPAPKNDNPFQEIPLKLGLTDIPNDFDSRALKDELLLILKKVVVELAERMDDLRITKIEEDFSRNTGVVAEAEDDRDATLDIFFKITVVRVEGFDFPSILITWIRDSYDDIVVMIREYTSQTYFGTKVGLNWCTQPEDMTESSLFSECNYETTKFSTRIKQVAEVPLKQMGEDLAKIHRRNIERDIDGIKVSKVYVKEILGLPGGYAEVVFEVESEQEYDTNYEDIILETIQKNEEKVLEEIQTYSIMELEKDLYWCLDTKERVYTTCEKPIIVMEEPPSSGFPLMIIVGIACGVIVLVFAGIACICFRTNKKRAGEKSELNMMSYMQGGSAGRARPRQASIASTHQMSRRDSLKQCKSGFDPMLDLMNANPTMTSRDYDYDRSMREDYRGNRGEMREMHDKRRSHGQRSKKKRPRNEARPANAAPRSGDDAAHIQDLVLAIEADPHCAPAQTEFTPPRDMNGKSRNPGDFRKQKVRRYEPEPRSGRRYEPGSQRREDPPGNALVLYDNE